MQHLGSIQVVKEQLKLLGIELQKQKKEKALLTEKHTNALLQTQKTTNEFKAVIAQKDEEIKKHIETLWSARAAKHMGLKIGEGESAETFEGDPALIDQKLLEEVNKLKEKTEGLKHQLDEKKAATEKLSRERGVLIKELKRMREDAAEIDNLKRTIQDLKIQNRETAGNLERVLQKKDEMLANYEKMLYGGQVDPNMGGKLPSEIIAELKAEFEVLNEEREEMMREMKELQDQNTELEMKVQFKDDSKGDAGAGKSLSDTNISETTEFQMGLEKFLVSYADMITLLLVMFIFLYSISKIDEAKFAEAFGKNQIETYLVRLTPSELKMLDKVKELVKDNVDPESIVRSDTRTILVTLNTSELFTPGNANFVDGADQVILNAVKDHMKDGVKQILIDGHTDNVTIKSNLFPSNWELSAARASHVARFLVETMRFPSERMVVAGYGEHRPLHPNDSDEHRAMNRRVEIKILKDKTVVKEEENKAAIQGKQDKPPNKDEKGKVAPPAVEKTAANETDKEPAKNQTTKQQPATVTR